MTKSFYDILGVDRSAEQDAIRVAYELLLQRYSAQAASGDADAGNRLKLARSAYGVLSTPQTKSLYDERLTTSEAHAIEPSPQDELTTSPDALGETSDVHDAPPTKPRTRNRSASRWWLLCIALGVPAVVIAVNYVSLTLPFKRIVDSDARNTGIEATAHYKYYILPKTAVFDLKTVPAEMNKLDVFRSLIQYAAALKERRFDTVQIAYRGNIKYALQGTYFQTLGEEYGSQNPMYTLRTFPEHLLKPDGANAFGHWSGGVLAVLTQQMTDFSEFHVHWYLEDMAKTAH